MDCFGCNLANKQEPVNVVKRDGCTGIFLTVPAAMRKPHAVYEEHV